MSNGATRVRAEGVGGGFGRVRCGRVLIYLLLVVRDLHRPGDDDGWRPGESTCMAVGADFFGPLILVQDTQRCPHLKDLGGGWLSAWVLWMELKSTRMPVVPGEHARTWTKSLQSVEKWPGLQAEDESGDDTCVCSEEAAAPPRVSPTVARVGGGLVTAGDSRSRFPDRRR